MTIQELIEDLERLRTAFGPTMLVCLPREVMAVETHYQADRDEFVVVLLD